MKKMLIRALVLGAVALPFVAFAAYDDVSLTTDTILTVGGVNLLVSGSTATIQSIEVANSGNDFTVVLDKNSTIKVTSADRRVLTTDAPAKYIITNTCTSSLSTLEFASYSAVVTIKVTPQSTTCTLTTTASTGGTRSSGGGGGAVKKVGAVIVPAKTVVQPAAVLPATATFGQTVAKFARALKVGSTGNDVKQLQQFLNANGFTVAPSGVGSPGKETTYMGKLTVEAIKKFQAKYGIATSGTPETTGYGALGPKTRAKLNSLIGQ